MTKERSKMANPREVFTTEEAAKRLRVSVITVRRKVRERKLKPIKGLCGRFRFTDEELRRFMYGKTRAA